jgi:hypothetical protein
MSSRSIKIGTSLLWTKLLVDDPEFCQLITRDTLSMASIIHCSHPLLRTSLPIFFHAQLIVLPWRRRYQDVGIYLLVYTVRHNLKSRIAVAFTPKEEDGSVQLLTVASYWDIEVHCFHSVALFISGPRAISDSRDFPLACTWTEEKNEVMNFHSDSISQYISISACEYHKVTVRLIPHWAFGWRNKSVLAQLPYALGSPSTVTC